MKVDYDRFPQIPPGCQLNVNKRTGVTQVFRQYRVLNKETGKKEVKRESVGTIIKGVFKLSDRWRALRDNEELQRRLNSTLDQEIDPNNQGAVGHAVAKVRESSQKQGLDQRRPGKIVYPFDPVLLAAMMSALTGGTESTQIANYLNTNSAFFRRCFPDLPEAGLSHDIVYRAFLKIDSKRFDCFYQEWIKPLIKDTNRRLLAADGQAVRASKRGICESAGVDSYMFMNIYDTKNHVCLAHMLIDRKTNEISVGPKMLAALDISGAIVVADAMSCQVDFVNAVMGGGADYCLSLKGNQDKSLDEVRNLFITAHQNRVKTFSDEIELDHGRMEQRSYKFLSGRLLSSPLKKKWRELENGTLVEVTSRVVEKKTGQSRSETRYYISSLPSDESMYAETARVIREHWAIENNLHGALDLNFHQDGIQAKNEKYLTNRVALNKLALTLLENYRYFLWNSSKYKDYPSLKIVMERCRNPIFAIECLACAQALL